VGLFCLLTFMIDYIDDMNDCIYIGFPNEGEVLMNLRLLYNWNMTDFKIVGDTVFFNSDGNTFSIRLEDFNLYFKNLVKDEKFLQKDLTTDE